jgi:hypothetical protein
MFKALLVGIDEYPTFHSVVALTTRSTFDGPAPFRVATFLSSPTLMPNNRVAGDALQASEVQFK